MIKKNISTKEVFSSRILLTLFILSLMRLAGFIFLFATQSIQMDFAAFYTAGEALNHGLSPYVNHITRDPMIWDGVAYYQHSRFLYPPLVANLFQPWALLPYSLSKTLWMFVSLVCIGVSLYLTHKIFPIRRRQHILVVGIYVALYHPLLTYLERGQIDAITLALSTLAFTLLLNKRIKAHITVGILLATATLLKLHCIYILPFVMVKKYWRVVQGYLIGTIIIGILTVVFAGTLTPMTDYLFTQLPRISKYASLGPDEMKVPQDVFQAALATIPDENDEGHLSDSGFVFTIIQQIRIGLPDYVLATPSSQAPHLVAVKDGQWYRQESFQFVKIATNVRVIRQALLILLKIDMSLSILSIIVYCCLFFVCYSILTHVNEGSQEFLSWHLILIIVMLSAPLTWVMNTVWLLPLAVVFMSLYANQSTNAHALYWIALGLIVVGLPDFKSFELLVPFGNIFMLLKYVVGQIMILGGFLVHLRSIAHSANLPSYVSEEVAH